LFRRRSTPTHHPKEGKEDGISFHASNRQRAPLFAVANGDVVAATLNAAMQRLDD
jgi:hypothetical protein